MHAATRPDLPDHVPAPVARLLDLFTRLDASCMAELEQVYSDDVLFTDPFHEIKGREALTVYFSAMYERVQYCRFDFQSVYVDHQRAMVRWTMTLSHPRLRGGAPIAVPGVSELAFTDRVHFHRDYFDGAQLLYNHLPVIGWLLARVRQRM